MIGFAIPIWKREETWGLVKSCVDRHPVTVSVTGSEGLDSRNRSKGYIYTETANDPLGLKANTSVEALRGLVDRVVLIGSDDVFDIQMFEFWKNSKEDFTGFTDCYFNDSVTGESVYWSGYSNNRKGEPIGAFKTLSANLLDKLNWKPFDDNINSSLDHSMMKKLKSINHSKKITTMKIQGVRGVDIKDEFSITKFAQWENTTKQDININDITCRKDIV